MSVCHLVWTSICHGVLRCRWGDSGFPLFPRIPDSLLPAPLTPRRMVEGQFDPGWGVTSPTGETDVAGGHPRMPDLSREGPVDVLQDRLAS